jgi:hypothetical protein
MKSKKQYPLFIAGNQKRTDPQQRICSTTKPALLHININTSICKKERKNTQRPKELQQE